ncbi:YraN family protein [Paenibacillus sp. GCM10023248]|uniref:YraN family protein n=1 Tax=Bacillales TaxID=1385 RepID=UPI00237919E4|nr:MULTISPECIES: YraN family protein [Bacillales]MDD9270268.1 YraN family protein [Paenibacillus sp. MAHUQ-63]MDR6883841.1 putative endonuclease [Bacillus sp. 3255]
MTDRRKDDRKQLGKLGEDLAEAYLCRLDYRILERNWRCRAGELDIVAEHAGMLVVVEVRTRRPSGRFGLAKESVDLRKQSKVREVVQHYLHRHRKYEQSVRFDVITVELTSDGSQPHIEHIEGAF